MKKSSRVHSCRSPSMWIKWRKGNRLLLLLLLSSCWQCVIHHFFSTSSLRTWKQTWTVGCVYLFSILLLLLSCLPWKCYVIELSPCKVTWPNYIVYSQLHNKSQQQMLIAQSLFGSINSNLSQTRVYGCTLHQSSLTFCSPIEEERERRWKFGKVLLLLLIFACESSLSADVDGKEMQK